MWAPIWAMPCEIRGSRFGLIGSKNGGTKIRAPLRPHLVDVVEDGREPLVVEQPRQELRLFEVEHEPVAVRVVPGVDVVKLGHPAPFPRVPLRPLVPARDLVDAVGVGRGDEQDDRLVEDLAHRRVVALASSCRSSIAIRVEAVSVEWIEQVIMTTGLLCATGRGQLLTRRGMRSALEAAIAIELPDRLGTGNDRDDVGPPLGRLAQRPDDDPVRRSIDLLEVIHDRRPVGEVEVVSGAVAEVCFGTGRPSALEPRGIETVRVRTRIGLGRGGAVS